jgi:hypothetical protein
MGHFQLLLNRIDFAHVNILGSGGVFSKRLLESTIAPTDLPTYCPRLTHWPFRFTSIFVMGWISHTDAR